MTGDCLADPGVELFVGFRLGLPVMEMRDVIPPVTWPLASHPTLPLVLKIPPDWTMTGAWADSFTDQGTPVWQAQPMLFPQLTSARVVSPDGLVVFEFAVGTIQGPPLDVEQAATIAKQGVLGDRPRLESICTFRDNNLFAPGWFHADYVDDATLICMGNAIPQSSVLFPSTIVTYHTMIGPSDAYEAIVRTYFIPLFFQFLGGGAGTPTPG